MEATFSTVYGETLHGGVKMTAFFLDENMEPCIRKKAKYMKIIEYDEKGHQIFDVIGTTSNKR